MTLGENLQNLRRAADLSQEEVAGKLFVSRQSVSKWENDQAEPGVENLKALAELYGVTMDQLILGDVTAKGEETGTTVSVAEKERREAAKNTPQLLYQILVLVRTLTMVFGGLYTWLWTARFPVPIDWFVMLLGLKFRNFWIYGILVVFRCISTVSNLVVVIFSRKIGAIELQCFGGLLVDIFFLLCLFGRSIRKYFHMVSEKEGDL